MTGFLNRTALAAVALAAASSVTASAAPVHGGFGGSGGFGGHGGGGHVGMGIGVGGGRIAGGFGGGIDIPGRIAVSPRQAFNRGYAFYRGPRVAGRVGYGRRVVIGGGFYDPWWGGYYYPYGLFPFPYYPYAAYSYGLDVNADVKVKVTPKNAQVFVDGYYAGVADDFDGAFQHLHVTPGGHVITVYLDGFRTLTRSVYVSPDSTVTFHDSLAPLAPGEVSARPAPPQAPTIPAVEPQVPPEQ